MSDEIAAVRAASSPPPARPRVDQRPGSHPLGEHAWHVVDAGLECWPDKTPDQAAAIFAAVAQCLDMIGGTAQASRPRAAAPAEAPTSSRSRATTNNPDRALCKVLPMNPGGGSHASGGSQPPPSDLDSSYWRNEVRRVSDHHDRCEVIRRAAQFLATLIRPDLGAARAVFTDEDRRTQILDDGLGWSLTDVARNLNVTERFVAITRIGDGRHPLTGKKWTPPKDNQLAAHQARAMRDTGLTSSDIGTALQRPPATVRAWTTQARRAAA